MAAGKGEKKGDGDRGGDQSVDTIRDILFGDAVRDLEAKLAALSAGFERRVEATSERAQAQLEDLKRDLSREQEAREADLSALGHDLGERLAQRSKELEREAAALRASQEAGRRDLAQLFRRLADSLDAEGDA